MIVITGGAGFLGSNLVHALNAQDYADIALVDQLTGGDDARWRNINGAQFRELFGYDALFNWLNDNSDQVEAVVSLGGPLGNATTTSMDALLEAHYALPKMLWDWCTLAQRPFLYASSAATYGDGSAGFEDTFNLEYLAKLRPLTEYGFAKHVFDKWVGATVAAGEARPPQVVGMKFFNIFGPHDYHEPGGSFMLQTYQNALADQPTTLLAGAANAQQNGQQVGQQGGMQQRDFMWVDDATDVMTWFLANPQVSGMFNIGTGIGRTYFDAVNIMYQALYRPPLVLYQELDEASASRMAPVSVANISRLKTAGYKPNFMALESAIPFFIENYLAPQKLYR